MKLIIGRCPAFLLFISQRSTVYILSYWRPLRESNPPYQDENLAS